MNEIICPNCGNPNRPGARFCGRCGYALEVLYSPPAWGPGRAPAPARPEGGSVLRSGAAAVGIAACVMFGLLFSLAFPVFSISGGLSDPDTYTSAIADAGAYEQFPELFGDQADYWVHDLASSFFLMEIFFRNIAREDWVLVAERILTPEWVQAQTEGLIEQFFDYTNGEVETLDLIVSFREVKQRLGGEVGYQTYTEITANKPDCNMLEMSQWLLAPTIGLLPVCNLPEEADFFIFEAPDPETVVPGVLADWAATLPDESNLADNLTGGALDEIDGTFGSLRLMRLVAGAFLLVSMLFLGVSLVWPYARTLKGWLRAWGVSILLSGLVLALMAVVSGVLLIWQVGDLFDGLAGVFVPGLIELGKEIGGNITLGLVTPLGVLGGVMVVLGFGMFAASFFAAGGRGGPRPAAY